MCGRYVFDYDYEALWNDFQLIKPEWDRIPEGEIFPTNEALVIVSEDNHPIPRLMTWGFTGYEKHQHLINARSETLLEKKRFSRLMEQQRCVVPATAFYEWEKQGTKKIRHTFASPAGIYFAGLYESAEDHDAFTIITMASAGDVAGIHDRQPVSLLKDVARRWIDPSIPAKEAYHLLTRQEPRYFLVAENKQLDFMDKL